MFHVLSLLFGALTALGSVLERLGGVLEASWRRLGAAAATDAAFDAAEAVSKRSWRARDPLLERLAQF